MKIRELKTGVDLVEIERIKKAYEKFGEKFLKRIFTEKEIEYAFKNKNPFIHLAGRFAAKEAVMKSIGSGFGQGVYFKKIEVIRDKSGKPEIKLHGDLRERFKNKKFSISITHDGKYALAFCIMLDCEE
ncbi:MAG: holo-ACP synthase [Candidatus Hydrothermales bacterium]